MKIADIKNKAYEFAKHYQETGNVNFAFPDKCTAAEGYLITSLAQTYYNIFIGLISKEQGASEQKKAFQIAKTII